MEEGMPLHIASSTASGFVVCCVMHPPDTIMSRMYNQTGNLYTSAFDCLSRTVKTEGIFALYKGYFAHLARILPHTVCQSHVFGRTMANVTTDLDPYTRRANDQAHALGRKPDRGFRDQREDMRRALCEEWGLDRPVYITYNFALPDIPYTTGRDGATSCDEQEHSGNRVKRSVHKTKD